MDVIRFISDVDIMSNSGFNQSATDNMNATATITGHADICIGFR